jgi:hypothetical protein
MAQLHLPVVQTSRATDAQEIAGFSEYYPLLYGLVGGQGEDVFHIRLRLLLLLARWHGSAPTSLEMARELGLSAADLTYQLGVLRSSGWLTEGESIRRYTLTMRGRILIGFLQFVAQPWTSHDLTGVSALQYEMADRLGMRPDLVRAQFETTLSVLEERIHEIDSARASENTEAVGNLVRSSKHDVKIARDALKQYERSNGALRAYGHAQRMHAAISRLSRGTAEISSHYKDLVTRDLLSEGMVTLGDMLDWLRSANLAEVADALHDHLWLPFESIWAVQEAAILDSGLALANQLAPLIHGSLPDPVAFAAYDPTPVNESARGKIEAAQRLLRERLALAPEQRLADWVDEPTWDAAVLHFEAVLDPLLSEAVVPVVMTMDPDGHLDDGLSGVVALVSAAMLRLGKGNS